MIVDAELTGTHIPPGAKRIILDNQRRAPVDVTGIAMCLGINVWELPDLGVGIAGKLFRDEKNGGKAGYSILLKASDPLVRKRFTCAHEIAHFILHRDHTDLNVSDDEFYRSQLSNAQETEANRLAAQILMPMHLIQAMIQSGTRGIPALARLFQVSETAMMIRLGIPVP